MHNCMMLLFNLLGRDTNGSARDGQNVIGKSYGRRSKRAFHNGEWFRIFGNVRWRWTSTREGYVRDGAQEFAMYSLYR